MTVTTRRPPGIPSGQAPGRLLVRITTSTEELLAQEVLQTPAAARELSDAHLEMVADWLDAHPAAHVSVRVYDGDDGRCVAASEVTP